MDARCCGNSLAPAMAKVCRSLNLFVHILLYSNSAHGICLDVLRFSPNSADCIWASVWLLSMQGSGMALELY
jgi:hypothetical protein